MDIFLIPETAPFAISAFIFLGLFAIELLLLVFGASFSGAIDDMLPDFDFDGADFSIGKAFSFVGFGRVPTLVLLMIFTLTFAAVGFGLQMVLRGSLGTLAPTWLAVLLSLPVTLALTGWSSGLVSRVVPNVHTTAVSEETLIGRAATITYGTATSALPASAEVRDEHGEIHHVQLKSDREGESYSEGQMVFITRIADGFYFAAADRHIN